MAKSCSQSPLPYADWGLLTTEETPFGYSIICVCLCVSLCLCVLLSPFLLNGYLMWKALHAGIAKVVCLECSLHLLSTPPRGPTLSPLCLDVDEQLNPHHAASNSPNQNRGLSVRSRQKKPSTTPPAAEPNRVSKPFTLNGSDRCDNTHLFFNLCSPETWRLSHIPFSFIQAGSGVPSPGRRASPCVIISFYMNASPKQEPGTHRGVKDE